jgi:hypothetical protein
MTTKSRFEAHVESCFCGMACANCGCDLWLHASVHGRCEAYGDGSGEDLCGCKAFEAVAEKSKLAAWKQAQP